MPRNLSFLGFNQREIPRFARKDKINYFLQPLQPVGFWYLQGQTPHVETLRYRCSRIKLWEREWPRRRGCGGCGVPARIRRRADWRGSTHERECTPTVEENPCRLRIYFSKRRELPDDAVVFEGAAGVLSTLHVGVQHVLGDDEKQLLAVTPALRCSADRSGSPESRPFFHGELNSGFCAWLAEPNRVQCVRVRTADEFVRPSTIICGV